MLVFFSKASVSKRGYVQKEFKLTCDILDQIPDEHIFVIPIRLDECEVPDRFRSLQWSDVFEEGDFEKVMKTLHQETKRMGLIKPMRLRSGPLEKLSYETILKMLRKKDFFDNYRNKKGKSLPHKYELIISHQKSLVVDLAKGLTFQQSGSNKRMTFDEANDYVSDLKTQKFGGYEDWRLPTLEEAMSLTKQRKQGALYIHSIFEQKQVSIWTADKKTSSLPWVVNFSSGLVIMDLETLAVSIITTMFEQYLRAQQTSWLAVRHILIVLSLNCPHNILLQWMPGLWLNGLLRCSSEVTFLLTAPML